MKARLKAFVIVTSTLFLFVMTLGWHVHHTAHFFVVHFAYIVIVFCGLWKPRWLPLVTAFIVIPHMVIDGLYLGRFPSDAVLESIIQVVVATTLYITMTWKVHFEERYDNILKEADIPFAHHRLITDAKNEAVDYEFLDVNPAFEQLIGFNKAALIGKTVLEILPETEAVWIKRYGDIAKSEKPTTFENFSKSLNKWFRVSAYAPKPNEFIVLAHDITDMRDQADRIAENEARFETLTRQSRTVVYELSLSGTFTYVSPSVITVLGYTPEALVGKPYETLFPKRVHAKQTQALQQRLSSGKRVEGVETALLTKKGSTVWVRSNSIPRRNAQGTLIAYLASDIDITEHKRAQSSLELFRTINEKAVYGSAIARPDGTLTYVNKAFAKMVGKSFEALIGKSLMTLHGKKQYPRVETLLKKMVDDGGFTLEEISFRHATGKDVPTLMSATTIYEAKKPKYLTATVIDVSERKDLRRALKETKLRYETVIDVSQTGMWEYNHANNTLWCSNVYFSMLGYDAKAFSDDADTLQTRWVALLHEEDRDDARAQFASYLKTRPDAMYENRFRMIAKDGSERWIYSRGNFIRHDDMKTDIVVGTHIDITEQILQEEKLRHAMHHDQLTGLYNRQYFYEQTPIYDTPSNYPLAFVFMDINGLKVINDAYGLEAGNEVINKVAQTILTLKTDDALVARLGGDEFGMLVPRAHFDTLEAFKSAFKKTVEAMPIHTLEYSVAIGYEFKTKADQDTAEIVMTAENHMYRNKTIEGASMRNRAVMSILKTLTDKYQEEKVHSERVAHYCKKIAEALKLDDESIRELELAGMLHDVGKISIPDAILNKPGPLDAQEWKIMKDHTVNGYQILHAADEYSNLADYALSHHERIDGSGYPNGLKDDAIPFFSKIISVVDAYEAMTSDRPYRKAIHPRDAIKELKKYAGTQFDANIVKLFINHVLSNE